MTAYTFDKSSAYYQQADQLYSTSAKLKWLDLVIKEAHGSIVTDIDGNDFIDLHGSGSCGNIGHSHPKVVAAIKAQADKLVAYSPGYFYHDEMINTMQKLIATTPGDFPKKVVFGNSGSDANDGMMKYARAYTGRHKHEPYIKRRIKICSCIYRTPSCCRFRWCLPRYNLWCTFPIYLHK